MKSISYFFEIQVCFSIIIIVNSYVIRDTTSEHGIQAETTEFEEKRPINKNRRSLAINDSNKLWDGGIIPYKFDDNFTGQQRKLIKQAMRHWEQSSCLQFVPTIEGLDQHYLLLIKTVCGCCSLVGKQHIKMQILSISDDCMSFGTIVHELGHAIGLFHEHNRPDRDEYVEILKDNIMIGEEINFAKESENSSSTLGQAYDYRSIMHYGKAGSAREPDLDTIRPLKKINDKWPVLGQRNRLSRGDIVMTNLLYHCLKCGGTLLQPYGIFSSPTQTSTQLDVKHCQWTIRAAEGHRIRLSIKSLNIRESHDCSTDYLEIRNGLRKNNDVIGHYCGKYETTLTVNSNIVQILSVRAHVDYDKLTLLIEYEAVCSNDIYIEYNDTFYLESPNYPKRYGPNKLCYWRITAPENHFILIKFYHFELQDSPHCESDVLEVREGDHFQAPINKMYCGKNDNLKITSIGRLMLLRFITDASINENGFSAVITAQSNTVHN